MKRTHPPSVSMVVRVGVTGHRLDSLKEKGFQEACLRAAIREVLARVRTQAWVNLFQNSSAYREVGARFRVISPLAEGSDRFVAEEALAMEFQLQSPLPFPREEYKADFESDASKAAFDELIERAQTAFELDGSRTAEEAAYEAVGRLVLRQSDLLIAIWDGLGPKGRGGTGQIVRDALLRKVPVVWISAFPPHEIRFLTRVLDDGKAAAHSGLDDRDDTIVSGKLKPEHKSWFKRWRHKLLRRSPSDKAPQLGIFDARLREILALPSKTELEALESFLHERQRHFRLAFWYRFFCKIFVWTRWKIPSPWVQNFDTTDKDKWLAPWKSLSEPNNSVGSKIERCFRRPFNWADGLSEIYADRYRSSFIVTYLSGASAVLAAFLGSYPGELPPWLVLLSNSRNWFKVEFVLISSILLLVALNKWGHWHERWIDYRLLAEGLRQMRALAPFAHVTPAFDVPAHLSDEHQGPAWFNWYFRALVREAGLVQAKIDTSYLGVCRTFLDQEIAEQVKYHCKTNNKYNALHHQLHGLSILLFLLTLIACVLHLSPIPMVEEILGKQAEGIVTLLTIVLPAFGAAIQGILHQGEFGRIARRSRSIKHRLESMVKQIEDPEQTRSFRDLGRATESFSEIQLLEQADWRSVFISKAVSLA
jgi:hypothetical protein